MIDDKTGNILKHVFVNESKIKLNALHIIFLFFVQLLSVIFIISEYTFWNFLVELRAGRRQDRVKIVHVTWRIIAVPVGIIGLNVLE